MAFSERGYILLEKQYRDNKTPMRYICSRHPERVFRICYNSLTANNSGCPICAGKFHWSIDDVRDKFSERGYVLLADDYVNNKEPLPYRCPEHPSKTIKISLNNLMHGYGCPYCGIEKRTGYRNVNWKGGMTELNDFLRPKLSSWRARVVADYDGACWVTGDSESTLQVHHVTPYSFIRDTAISNLGLVAHKTIGDYTVHELDSLLREFLQLHDETAEGVALRADVHRQFHKVYGLDGGWDSLCAFKARCLDGDFAVPGIPDERRAA